MATKYTFATTQLTAGYGAVTLSKLGDIGANFFNHTHELMPKHITLLHALYHKHSQGSNKAYWTMHLLPMLHTRFGDTAVSSLTWHGIQIQMQVRPTNGGRSDPQYDGALQSQEARCVLK